MCMYAYIHTLCIQALMCICMWDTYMMSLLRLTILNFWLFDLCFVWWLSIVMCINIYLLCGYYCKDIKDFRSRSDKLLKIFSVKCITPPPPLSIGMILRKEKIDLQKWLAPYSGKYGEDIFPLFLMWVFHPIFSFFISH